MWMAHVLSRDIVKFEIGSGEVKHWRRRQQQQYEQHTKLSLQSISVLVNHSFNHLYVSLRLFLCPSVYKSHIFDISYHELISITDLTKTFTFYVICAQMKNHILLKDLGDALRPFPRGGNKIVKMQVVRGWGGNRNMYMILQLLQLMSCFLKRGTGIIKIWSSWITAQMSLFFF